MNIEVSSENNIRWVENYIFQIRGKLHLSRKLRYYRGSRFSHCFILSTGVRFGGRNQKLFRLLVVGSAVQTEQ